ncbi:hypothetical protein H2201_002630 [Coniosporium apollinis]|uniref:Uncharacterized protein n=1 Tax=Coniosporium apollinis TaxID=61459 RepID=A0ABQ9NXJ6_9PEZI|nr:hypothetical protein H2201_002630 [Coniosporium apollinis]
MEFVTMREHDFLEIKSQRHIPQKSAPDHVSFNLLALTSSRRCKGLTHGITFDTSAVNNPINRPIPQERCTAKATPIDRDLTPLELVCKAQAPATGFGLNQPRQPLNSPLSASLDLLERPQYQHRDLFLSSRHQFAPHAPDRLAAKCSVPTHDTRLPSKQTFVAGSGKTTIGLPITIETETGPATVMSCPDTGSEENIISEDLAHSLGLAMFDDAADRRFFELANGKRVQSVGRVQASCRFVSESSISPDLACIFYVFRNVATDLIMGRKFLGETETLTAHRERLVRLSRRVPGPLRVRAVCATQQVICKLGGKMVSAIADSGSELNLMSPEFARKQGYVVEEGEEVIMFADGSLAYTSGVAYVSLSVDLRKIHGAVTTAFYLLQDLVCDVLLGEDTLEDFEVFTTHQDALRTGLYDAVVSCVNRIIHIGPVERAISCVQETVVRGINDLFYRRQTPVHNSSKSAYTA